MLMISDFKYALRTLAKTPGFTIIAVVTLALAIGANTAIFSLINDLFLRGLPFKEPSRIVHMFAGDKSRNLVDIALSAPRFQHYREGQTLFDGFAAEAGSAFTLTGVGDPVQVFGGRGYMRSNVAERFLRELRVDRIWEGTSEIQRLIIARSLERRGVDRVVG